MPFIIMKPILSGYVIHYGYHTVNLNDIVNAELTCEDSVAIAN